MVVLLLRCLPSGSPQHTRFTLGKGEYLRQGVMRLAMLAEDASPLDLAGMALLGKNVAALASAANPLTVHCPARLVSARIRLARSNIAPRDRRAAPVRHHAQRRASTANFTPPPRLKHATNGRGKNNKMDCARAALATLCSPCVSVLHEHVAACACRGKLGRKRLSYWGFGQSAKPLQSGPRLAFSM